MLGYPVPTLIAWGQEGKEAEAGGWVMSGGSHMAKISATLNYLNGLDPAQDNDLVIMIDAYDVWFQLPKSVLMERYHMINEQANKRIIKQIGSDAMQKENVTQSIIFGSGKRCAPNQLHTIACYPIPASPLPDDIYYGNTDTDIGPNEFASRRQRWLNSGVIVGPVAKLRELFAYAEELAKSHPANDPQDNGSHGSDNMYHGSDQSIFATIRGQQEYQREVIHRQYNPHYTSDDQSPEDVDNAPAMSSSDKAAPQRLSRRGGGNIDVLRYDPLNPPFTHEEWEAREGHSYEYGIGVDHFSDLTHETINSETDGRWLLHNQSLPEQITGRTRFDCKWRLPDRLPNDMLSEASTEVMQKVARKMVSWEDQTLYTHLCTGTVPVIVHHNGDKDARTKMWHLPWWKPYVKDMMGAEMQNEKTNSSNELDWEKHRKAPATGEGASWGGAWIDRGEFLSFDELCPAADQEELFRMTPLS